MPIAPQKTSLYKRICRDYRPKEAEMMICQYIEGLEARIEEMETKAHAPEATIAQNVGGARNLTPAHSATTATSAGDPVPPITTTSGSTTASARGRRGNTASADNETKEG